MSIQKIVRISLPQGGEAEIYHEHLTAKPEFDGIGYLHFTNFITGMTKRFPAAFDVMRNAPGIIIDLRGNSGGVTEVGLALAAIFIEKETTIFIVRTRKGEYQYKAKPQKNSYRGPVVVLIDEASASESEELNGWPAGGGSRCCDWSNVPWRRHGCYVSGPACGHDRASLSHRLTAYYQGVGNRRPWRHSGP